MMRFLLAKYWLLALLTMWVAGCSSQRISPLVDWTQHQQQLQQLAHHPYQARGALIYRSTNRTLYVRFYWQQHAANYFQLQLINPLGQSVLTVIYQAGWICLRDQAGQTQTGQEAEKQLQALVGLQIPLHPLMNWLIGLPNPGDHFHLNPQQQLWQLTPALFAETPLQLNYLAYHPPRYSYASPLRTHSTVRQPALPARLLLRCGNRSITLKIDRWIVP